MADVPSDNKPLRHFVGLDGSLYLINADVALEGRPAALGPTLDELRREVEGD